MQYIYRIIGGRSTGKTRQLMSLAKEHNGILVCSNPAAMKKKAYAYGLVGFDIISYQDFIDKNYDTEKPCFIDELEVFIKRGLGKAFGGYTLSMEE